MESYAIASWIFLRGISIVYLIAFATLLNQALGLWGSQGILPASQFLSAVQSALGAKGYWYVPTVFWFKSSDAALLAVLWLGILASLLALLGVAQGWMLAACFVFYLSYVAVGEDFLSFQWDALLLEVGFLALFMAPWNFRIAPFEAFEPHWLVRWTLWMVLFKLMFSSGLVKLLSGDPTWRNFTALTYHYWTQPIPNALAPFIHALPEWVHRVSTAIMFVIELGLPFLIFIPRLRLVAAAGFAFLMVLILITGNYAFFNWLTLVMIVLLLPDAYWAKLLDYLPWKLEVIAVASPQWMIWPLAAVMSTLMLLSVFWCVRWWLPDFVHNVFSPVVRVTATLRLSSSYGLFANMTKSRPEIVIEGSDDGEQWREYEFSYKAGNINARPPLIAPYQPRLDWQMWFAALGSFQDTRWLRNLMVRLMENSSDVTGLLQRNPFPNHPPKYLRAQLYMYEFTRPGQILKNGVWWERKHLTQFSPTLERR